MDVEYDLEDGNDWDILRSYGPQFKSSIRMVFSRVGYYVIGNYWIVGICITYYYLENKSSDNLIL